MRSYFHSRIERQSFEQNRHSMILENRYLETFCSSIGRKPAILLHSDNRMWAVRKVAREFRLKKQRMPTT